MAKASQETRMISPKLTMEERLMYLYKYLLAYVHNKVKSTYVESLCTGGSESWVDLNIWANFDFIFEVFG
jgi:hypothetical protein